MYRERPWVTVHRVEGDGEGGDGASGGFRKRRTVGALSVGCVECATSRPWVHGPSVGLVGNRGERVATRLPGVHRETASSRVATVGGVGISGR